MRKVRGRKVMELGFLQAAGRAVSSPQHLLVNSVHEFRTISLGPEEAIMTRR